MLPFVQAVVVYCAIHPASVVSFPPTPFSTDRSVPLLSDESIDRRWTQLGRGGGARGSVYGIVKCCRR